MYKNPLPVVDVIILHENSIALVKRKKQPFKGMWALPGGFIEYGEEPYRAAIREAKEETGLNITLKDKKNVFAYGNPKRDPRGHLISLVFISRAKNPAGIKGMDDATDARFFPLEKLPAKLAADHRKILKDILGW
ncbi:MAG: NUDIX hydrolase [Candidatus Aenigmarchaeota archaeon]|nr:NUDIX hydrolase [Candidatus Aenigmarchaeota archaeon]